MTSELIGGVATHWEPGPVQEEAARMKVVVLWIDEQPEMKVEEQGGVAIVAEPVEQIVGFMVIQDLTAIEEVCLVTDSGDLEQEFRAEAWARRIIYRQHKVSRFGHNHHRKMFIMNIKVF
jgi:hypothetical protein